MGCKCSGGHTSDQVVSAYIACSRFPPIESPAAVQMYVQRVGANAKNGDDCYVTACLMIHRLIYWKSAAGDCGSPTKPDINKPLALASGFAGSTFLNPTALTAELTAGPVGWAAAAGSAILGVFTGFSAHHAQAVAKEQSTLCAVSLGYNGFADAMEQALKKGQIKLQDAVNQLNSAISALDAQAATVSDINTFNFGSGVRHALKALQFQAVEKIYPSLTGGISGGRALALLAAGGGGLILARGF